MVNGIQLSVRDVLNKSTANEEKSEYNIFCLIWTKNEHEVNNGNEDGVIEICPTETVPHDLNHSFYVLL